MVIQADTRKASTFYLKDTMALNTRASKILGYQYKFVNYDSLYRKTGLNPKYLKIHVVRDTLNSLVHMGNYSTFIFMDADAWIQSTGKVQQLVHALARTPVSMRGFISRDPLGGWGTTCSEKANEGKNEPYTLINSGAFILKVTKRNQLLFDEMARNVESCKRNLFKGVMPSFDQAFVSSYVFQRRKEFGILKCEVLNSPQGVAIRHHWFPKNKITEAIHKLPHNLPEITANESFSSLSSEWDDQPRDENVLTDGERQMQSLCKVALDHATDPKLTREQLECCPLRSLGVTVSAEQVRRITSALEKAFEPPLCSNTCESPKDGSCDDGGRKAGFAMCELGTDCADCGLRRKDGKDNAIHGGK
jgi:hypothetical protein